MSTGGDEKENKPGAGPEAAASKLSAGVTADLTLGDGPRKTVEPVVLEAIEGPGKGLAPRWLAGPCWWGAIRRVGCRWKIRRSPAM